MACVFGAVSATASGRNKLRIPLVEGCVFEDKKDVRRNPGLQIADGQENTSEQSSSRESLHTQLGSTTAQVARVHVPERSLLLRRVNNSGDISWHKNRVFISEVFRFEELGIELITPGPYRVFFRDMEIGEFSSEEMRFRAARRVL